MTPIDASTMMNLFEEAARQYSVFEKTKVLLFTDVILELLNKEECVSVYYQLTASKIGRYIDYDETCIFLEIVPNPNLTRSELTIGVLYEATILDIPITTKRVHKNRHLAQARKVIDTTLPVGTVFIYNSLKDTINKM